MHDQPLDQHNLSPNEIEHNEIEHMDRRILRALETIPEPDIPAGFAARVASQLPARRPESLTPTHYGHNATRIAIVLTFVTMLALALRDGGRPSFSLLESFLLTQFIILVIWLSVWRRSLR